MKTLKFFLLWMVMTVIMAATWSVGSWLGNTITRTSPPPVEDTALIGLHVLVGLFDQFPSMEHPFLVNSHLRRTKEINRPAPVFIRDTVFSHTNGNFFLFR